jgi:hypothetical protein
VSYFYYRTFPRVDPIYDQLRAAGTYLDAFGGDRPAVFILDRRGPAALYSARFRTYVVKAEMPADVVAHVLIFPGTLLDLEAGRPTLLPEDAPWKRSFNESSRTAWAAVGPALRRGATVLIAQRFAIDQFRAAMTQDPTRLVAPGLYLVRGSFHRLGPIPPRPSVGVVAGAFVAVALFVLLWVAGWGFARLALAPVGAGWFDLALLSPAIGAGACVVIGFVVAAAGGDPRGTEGIAALVLVVAASAVAGWRGGRSRPDGRIP